MTTTYTFPRSAFVGFDHLFTEFNRTPQDTYPPHNIVQIDDDNFLVEIAVAGFSKGDLDIQLKDSVLTVTGSMEDTRTYLKNGILSISLSKVIPESERPKKIEIGSTFIQD